MRFGTSATLSLVACHLLVGADYKNWATTNFVAGDTVTINSKSTPPQVLNKSLTLANGTLTVKVDATGMSSTCGMIACFNQQGNYTLGSAGSTIDFKLSGFSQSPNVGAFEIRNSTALTVSSDVSINTTGSNIDDVFQVADSTLDFQSAVTIKATQAINAGKSTIKLGQTGKKIDITGDFKFTNSSTVDIKLTSDSKISGNINAVKSTINLDMSDTSKITGNFSGTDDTKLKLNMDKTSIYSGNIENSGQTTIDLKEQAKITGKITTLGAQATITGKGSAQIQGGIRNQSGQLTVIFDQDSSISGGIENLVGRGNITFKDNAKLKQGQSIFSTMTTMTFENSSKAENAQIRIDQDTSTILFKEISQMSGGRIENQGGIANITFMNTAKMVQGTIHTDGGTTKLEVKNQADLSGTISQSDGKSTINFTDTSKMNGKIEVRGGETKITFTGPNGGDKTNPTNAQMIGDILAGGSKNTVSFEAGTKLTGKLTLDGAGPNIDGQSLATITKAWITQDVQGFDEVDLIVKDSQIDGAIKQGGTFSQKGMHATIEGSTIKGGFAGKDSSNLLKIINGSFENSNIKQEGEGLQAEIISLQKLGNFEGINSQNTVHLSRTKIKNISQSWGGLELRTDSDVQGAITGTNQSQNKITVTGGNVVGNISQNTGSMELTLNNGEARNISASNGADFGFYATNYKATTISLDNAISNGISNGFELTGNFNQNGGTSNLTFAGSTFRGTTILTNTTSSDLIFTASHLQGVQATNGRNNITLSDGSMKNFTGNNGTQGLTMTNSTAQNFAQTDGSLTLNASAGSKIDEITGNRANLSLAFNVSQIFRNVSNNGGNTTISLQDSKIGGNVIQTNGAMNLDATNSQIRGEYRQDGGTFAGNLTQSKIEENASFRNVVAGVLNLNQDSHLANGLRSADSTLSFNLRNQSSIQANGTAGAIEQSGGKLIGSLDQSKITGSIELKNGITEFSLFNASKITGNIDSQNNETTILLDRSQIEGNITVENKFLHLTARNQSVIRSNLLKLTDADLKLILDTGSKFIGELKQTNNKQEIFIKQDSVFQGNITNIDTKSTIIINRATLQGSLTQTRGTLGLELSSAGKITGNISLNQVATTLSGTGNGNQIGGNFTQTDGSVTGLMNGLTLNGTYSQNGGTSSVKFTNSAFQNSTTITNAASSSLTFDRSTLKAYKISGGNDNTLKLLNQSKMTGDLTLENMAKALLKMDSSTITGNIRGTNDSILTLDTLNSTITGNIDFDTGGIKGSTNNTKINGSITLTKTESNVSFTKKSTIGGNLTATRAGSDNIIKLDNSRIEGEARFEDGSIDLDLSNGSSIGRDLTFKNTTAHLTGSPARNKIEGNFLSEETTLTGEISGLTLHGTFKQEKGTSDIIFRDNSLFKGAVSINEAISSHLKFLNKSGIENQVTITKGDENKISLGNQSFIKGNIQTAQSKAMIVANDRSLITGDITANNAKLTNLSFDSSALTGNITQTDGDFKLKASNQSLLRSNLNLTNTQASIDLFSQSALEGSVTLTSSNLIFNLDHSRFNTIDNPQDLKTNDSDLSINASNNSIFGANLKSTSATGNHRNTMNFLSSSTYSGTMELSEVKTEAKFNESSLFSDLIKINKGSFDLSFDHSKLGGLVKAFEAEETSVKIKAQNESEFQITNAMFKNSTLNLLAESDSRLSIGLLELDNETKASYEALTNGNLNVNTQIKDNLSTLKVNIEGGILQGSITHDAQTATTGEVILKASGDLGGRWIVTDDSQIKELKLENQDAVLASGAIFSSPFKSPLTFVDFTMNFEDKQTSSRVGKEMIKKPIPQQGQPIPQPGANQTYARELQMQSLLGTNGLFRVYADLGTKMADKIVAENASGDHLIQVYYRVDTFREIGGDRIVVAHVIDPTTTATFKGTQSEIGLTRYDTEIIKENSADGRGFEWIIGQATPAGMSYSSKIIASILQSQYRAFAIETDSLDRRLGGLERIERDKGFWIRSFIGQASKDATDYSTSTTDKYFSVWSGFDYNAIGLTGHNFLGMFFNYSGMQTENKDYTGKLSNFALGVYNVFKAHSGFYFDLLAKYIYTTSEFDISSYALAKNKPKFDNHKFLANFEMGYTFYLGEKRKSLYIEPQFQITSGYIQGVSINFVDVTGEIINANLGHNAPAMMRLGVFVGKTFGEKLKINLKGGTSLAYDVNSGGNLTFEDSSASLKRAQKGDFRMLFSAHSDFEFSDSFRMYASFDTSFFGSYNTTFNVNLGLRFTFGARNNVISPVPMVYNPYDPPVPINDDKRTIPVVRTYTAQDINANYRGKTREIPKTRKASSTRSAPYQGYAPQPSSRKSYRDPSFDFAQENAYR